MLLAGLSVTAIATACAVERKTIYRWRNEPAIAMQLAEAQNERVNAAKVSLDIAAADAVETMIRIMRSRKSPPALRQRAAESILDRSGIKVAGDRRPEDMSVSDLVEAAKEIISEVDAVTAEEPSGEGGTAQEE